MIISFVQKAKRSLCINSNSSNSDAVYGHTPNENSDNFPIKFDEATWNTKVPKMLEDLIDTTRFEFGSVKYDDETVYFIYSKNHGIAI
jgi:hypothetical protein